MEPGAEGGHRRWNVGMSLSVMCRLVCYPCSVQFSRSVVSDSLRHHGLQHTRPPCPSPTPRACSNSCPLSQWCHPTISLCRPLLLLPSIFPSIRLFINESTLCIRWPKYWSFSFSISPSNEYSGLISFRIDWFDLLAVQGTVKSPLQHRSSKASIIQHSAFFMVQLSHPYMTTGKNIAILVIWWQLWKWRRHRMGSKNRGLPLWSSGLGLSTYCRGMWVQFLVWELRSQMQGQK